MAINGSTALTTTRDYSTDVAGRLKSITNKNGANETVASYTYNYNAANQRVLAALADGTIWEYGYNGRGEVTSGAQKLGAGGDAMAGRLKPTFCPPGQNFTCVIGTECRNRFANNVVMPDGKGDSATHRVRSKVTFALKRGQ